MFGAMPNPDPDGDDWTVLVGSPSPDDENDDPEVTIVALTEDVDLGDVTEKEIRFSLYEDDDENPHAVYQGVSLHRHTGDEDDEQDCEVFYAADGRTDVADVPDDLRTVVEDVLEMEIHEHGEEPADAFRVRVSDLTEPDTEPRGYQ